MGTVILKNKNILTKEIICISSELDCSSYKFEYDYNELSVIKDSVVVVKVDREDINYIKGHNTYIHNLTYNSKINDINKLNRLNVSAVYIDMEPESKVFSFTDIWDIHYNGYKFKVRRNRFPLLSCVTLQINKVELSYDKNLLNDEATEVDELLIIGLLSYCWFHFFSDDISSLKYAG